MPLHIPDHNAPRLKIELLGGIFSSIAYGIVIVLSGNCFHLLQRKQGIYSNRMRIILLIYVTFMLLISTWAVMGPIFIFMNIFSIINNLLFYHSTQLPITVTMWGADGFLVWRCLVLYHDVSRGPRIAIIVLLSLISLASFVCGVAALVEEMKMVPKLQYLMPVCISLSALVNIILAALIVFRLVCHRRYFRNALGVERGSPYTNIIIMCVESSALMVIVGGLYTILYFVSWNGQIFMFDIAPHIYVISPLLIVYRVALGRAILPTSLPPEQAMAQIQVNISVSSRSGQEGEV